MAVPEWLSERTGTWGGPHRLYLEPGVLKEEATLTAHVAPRAGGTAVELALTWTLDGAPKEGVMVLAFGAEGSVTGMWTDSWHSAGVAMALTGSADERGVDVSGTYPAPPGPDWGWRITVSPDGERGLVLRMYNRTPDGDEALAVDAPLTSATPAGAPLPLGAFSVSLAVADIAASRAFYEQLGFRAQHAAEGEPWAILRNGAAVIGLFQGMFDSNILTFNPGWGQLAQPLQRFVDVRDIQAHLDTAGIELTQRADPDSDGVAHIALVDPDGNAVLIDQHVPKPG